MRSAGAAACARNSGAFRLVPMQVVPVDLGDVAHRRRIEGRSVVDENVELPKASTAAFASPGSCSMSSRSHSARRADSGRAAFISRASSAAGSAELRK